jgi:hypothetical protein
LDLACGQNKQEGFTGVDIGGDADIVHDLLKTPWPFRKNTVEETFSSHFAEHIPHYRPEFNGLDGWWRFFNELYRVCKGGAKCVFVHPYAKHQRAFWDPTHTRYIHETTWYYLDKNWRESQRLDHYHATCDFEVVLIQGTGVDANTAGRSHEVQAERRNYYWDVIPDLIVELKVRK